MTDKEKFRKEVEKLKSNLIHGACSSQVAMETRCKEEAYNEVLAILDTMQEEPVSGLDNGDMPIERWKQAVKAASNQRNYRSSKGLTETRDDYFVDGVQWADEHPKEEPVSEDLGEYINELSKQFPEVSFAKLSRIAVRVSRWQQNQDVKNKLPKVTDRTELDEYAYQCAYNMSNDWAIDNPTWHDVENACKLGAKWQKGHLWKPADGDELPEIDREVVVLIKYNAQRNIHDEEYPTYRVGFGHRPNPDGWDGKNIDTNEVTHYTPKLYDKGGWNAPNIVYWLDARLPYEENKISK